MNTFHYWCFACKKALLERELQETAPRISGQEAKKFCPECTSVLVSYANQDLDLHSLLVALGDRAFNSIWVGSGLDCYGAAAEELCALTDREQPITGDDFLRLTTGIEQTIDGIFKAYEPGCTSHWLMIRAWDGGGFYIEIDDVKRKEGLRLRFRDVEELEGDFAPLEALFIPCNR